MASASGSFLTAFRSLAARRGWSDRYSSPWALIDAWRGFVEGSKDGYSFTLYEWQDERGVRMVIQEVLDALEVSDPTFAKFLSDVNELDEQFKAIVSEVPALGVLPYWWERVVLDRAGSDYAEDVKGEFGIEIEVM